MSNALGIGGAWRTAARAWRRVCDQGSRLRKRVAGTAGSRAGRCGVAAWLWLGLVPAHGAPAPLPPPFPQDPAEVLERTCFQTGQGWSPNGNLRSDVAIVYGIDPGLPERIRTWRERGYRIHVMTGVSWGNYQDYLYGRFDGVNHEDEAQTDREGRKISHGGDVYYMSPGDNYGKFLCVGVQRALDAGAEAIHLEEPEFWVRGGYSEGFKRAWKAHYGEDWQPPHGSVDAQWRSSKLKYHLYRHALQQVFDHIQDFNRRTGRQVRCYVPTHSLLNYAHWKIVSPESSLARLDGCDGYIAQVWTGTSRTTNQYRGVVRERTFETAFLEYGAMQNLVRATGRTVWYLNDPIEDNPRYDWDDYRRNWESTLVASLLQPDVWRFEVAPWPERVFGGRYPAGRPDAQPIPPPYASEVQTVCQALADLRQPKWSWDAGTAGVGVVVSDSLMFQRGDPHPSDRHLGNVYGLALPLLKRGLPVTPVQLENVTVPGYLRDWRVLVLSYHGMKPLDPSVHEALADWVRRGGSLVLCDDDADPYHAVRDWWNSGGRAYATPLHHLLETLGLPVAADGGDSGAESRRPQRVGRGAVFRLREAPARLAAAAEGDLRLTTVVRAAAEEAGLRWRETAHLILRRGPYVAAAGLDESIGGAPIVLRGRYVNLFDPDLGVRESPAVEPGDRLFLVDLDRLPRRGVRVVASSMKALPRDGEGSHSRHAWAVEGIDGTPGIVLLRARQAPRSVNLAPLGGGTAEPVPSVEADPGNGLYRIRFPNRSVPRVLTVEF